MEKIRTSLKQISSEHKGLLWSMVALAILSLALLIISLVTLSPSSSVVKVGYGDIGRYQGGEWSSMSNSGGYHDGSWMEMLAFPILAVVFGVMHSLVALKLFEKRGAGVAQLFILVSITLVIGAFLVLIRLLREG